MGGAHPPDPEREAQGEAWSAATLVSGYLSGSVARPRFLPSFSARVIASDDAASASASAPAESEARSEFEERAALARADLDRK